MFPSLNNNDLFNKYKQQTYRLAFPFGVVITILYVIIATEGESARFYLGIAMAATLIVLTFLVWRGTRFLNTIELIFYFVVVAHFFLLTQLSLNTMIARGILVPTALSDQVNSLGMWLIVFMVAGFLTLKSNQARTLILCIFFGMMILGLNNIWFLISTNQLTSSYLFRWVNPLSGLLITILLIQRMGVLQQNNASTDSLTGLMNRRALYQILGREMERSLRYKKKFSIVLFDVDHFKTINDTYGHIEGDCVLKGLSDLIGKAIRQMDSIGRWGGEEFLLVLPETDSKAAKLLAERICLMIRETKFRNGEQVTASFGVTTFQSDWGLEEMLHHADNAMYQAKQNGRNQVVADLSTIPPHADK
jgi:diguanylate cyclase (GGDEF)-like protein